jgi:hypothetical protein
MIEPTRDACGLQWMIDDVMMFKTFKLQKLQTSNMNELERFRVKLLGLFSR